MKKIYALMLAAVLMFSAAAPVCANVISPTGESTEEPGGDTSPKTGDLSLIYIGAAGLAFAATAVAASKKSGK